MRIQARAKRCGGLALAAEETEHELLIECVGCKTWAYTEVSCRDYEVLYHGGTIPRDCIHCGETTHWKQV